MHRFHLPPDRCREPVLQLDGREAHHALHVLRVQRGEPILILDGAGHTLRCDLTAASKDTLTLTVQSREFTPPPVCPITLLVAIPKGRLMEDLIPKAVELGAHRIIPLLTERVVTHLDADGAEAKRDKWRQTAIEAMKQSGASWLPQVEIPVNLSAYLARRESFELPFVGSLQTTRRHPREWLVEFQNCHQRLPHSAAIWIGPEGDFTAAEMRQIEAAGARPITLGPLTLRVETAVIYCLSFLSYELAAHPPVTVNV